LHFRLKYQTRELDRSAVTRNLPPLARQIRRDLSSAKASSKGHATGRGQVEQMVLRRHFSWLSARKQLAVRRQPKRSTAFLAPGMVAPTGRCQYDSTLLDEAKFDENDRREPRKRREPSG
jgi:hypothetical protein